ncbi:hypothetical protein OSTOST_24872, partial [Ostertagia ostertagi]
TKLRGPSFRCEPQADGTLLLHYYSKRSGLYPIVKGLQKISCRIPSEFRFTEENLGVVREVARRIYDTEVIMKVQERKQEHLDAFVTEHVVFVISQVETAGGHPTKAISSKVEQLESNTREPASQSATRRNTDPVMEKMIVALSEKIPNEAIEYVEG